jgi:biopolymer transport protein ExbB/TolQ
MKINGYFIYIIFLLKMCKFYKKKKNNKQTKTKFKKQKNYINDILSKDNKRTIIKKTTEYVNQTWHPYTMLKQANKSKLINKT